MPHQCCNRVSVYNFNTHKTQCMNVMFHLELIFSQVFVKCNECNVTMHNSCVTECGTLAASFQILITNTLYHFILNPTIPCMLCLIQTQVCVLCRYAVNMSSACRHEGNVLAHTISILLSPTGKNGSFHDISYYMDTSDFSEQEKHLLREPEKDPLPIMCEVV